MKVSNKLVLGGMIAGLVAGCLLCSALLSNYPKIAAIYFAVLVTVLFLLGRIGTNRDRRRRAESETILAGLACRKCGAIYGAQAAHAAFHSAEILPGLKSNLVNVGCPACGERDLYDFVHNKLLEKAPAAAIDKL